MERFLPDFAISRTLGSMKTTENELLDKAKLPGNKAMSWHPFYRGKMEVTSKCQVKDFSDFGVWYTPGVAEPCRAIEADPMQVFEYTNRWNYIAVEIGRASCRERV